MVAALYWDPDPVIFIIPWVQWPVLWYGVLFAVGFFVGFRIFIHILSRYFKGLSNRQPIHNENIQKEATTLADRLILYVILGTVLGARIGHFLFYETAAHYLKDPLELFRTWHGGLSSHGAVLGIFFALILFRYRIRGTYPQLSWIRLLDLLSVPSLFISFCIRIGNFLNQEILGTPTSVPWAIVFGHPIDQSLPMPRHPAQLYEAFWYLMMFLFLGWLSKKPSFLMTEGKLSGILLILVFSFRFIIESFKIEQSQLLGSGYFLLMGQILSLPMIGLGVYLFFKNRFD